MKPSLPSLPSGSSVVTPVQREAMRRLGGDGEVGRLVTWRIWIVAVAVCLGSNAPSFAQLHDGFIDHPEKIGIGAVEYSNNVSYDFNDMDQLGVSWYYNWTAVEYGYSGAAEFVPEVWGWPAPWEPQWAAEQNPSEVVLGFNEPDSSTQSNLSVQDALDLWENQVQPAADAVGDRLGGPATAGSALGSWQTQFMQGVEQRGLRVDFMVVHYYQSFPDVAGFKQHLENVYATYQRPIWIKEWSLVDFNNFGLVSMQEQVAYFNEAVQMLDDLEFVERHAWFNLYPYPNEPAWGDTTLWAMNPLNPDSSLTILGEAFANAASQAAYQPFLADAGFDLGEGSNYWFDYDTGAVENDPQRGLVFTAGADSGVFHYPIELGPGEYTLTFLARQSGSGDLYVGFDGVAAVDGGDFFRTVTPSSEWEQHTLEFALTQATTLEAWFWGDVGLIGEYSIDDVFLTSSSDATPGDFNRDGLVDQQDYELWRDQFGATGVQLADANSDRVVDAADFTRWRDSYSQAGASIVPEPCSFTLLAASLAELSCRRRPRQASALVLHKRGG